MTRLPYSAALILRVISVLSCPEETFMLQVCRPVFVLAFLLTALSSQTEAAPVTLDFEGLSEFTTVTTQFPGVTFSNATVLTAGSSLNEFEFPPFSGQNVVFDDGGAMTVSFATAITSFSGYFTYTVPLTLTAFDASNNAIASVSSSFGSNLALSGELGSLPLELLSLSSATGFFSVLISGDAFGGSFVVDDVTFETPSTSTPVPEPGTFSLLASGVVLFGYRCRRSRKINGDPSAMRG